MKAKELKQKPENELKELLKESQNKLFKLLIEKQQSRLKNVSQIKTIKRDVARLKMMLKKMEIGISK